MGVAQNNRHTPPWWAGGQRHTQLGPEADTQGTRPDEGRHREPDKRQGQADSRQGPHHGLQGLDKHLGQADSRRGEDNRLGQGSQQGWLVCWQADSRRAVVHHVQADSRQVVVHFVQADSWQAAVLLLRAEDIRMVADSAELEVGLEHVAGC